MPNTPPIDFDLIESAISGNDNDFRQLLQNIVLGQQTANEALGITPTNTKNIAAPPQATISVAGANGAFNYGITQAAPGQQYHEVSYAPNKGFTNGVVTLPVSTATSGVVNAPGQSVFFRVRSSFNKSLFNKPTLHGQSAVSSGLISSAAIADGAALAQSNLMTVTSSQGSGTAAIHISGAGGTLTSGVALKSGVQTILPPATIIGSALGSNNFVGFDGHSYQVKPTLGAVLLDGLRPVGKVVVEGDSTPGQDGGGGAEAGNGARMTAV
jgi:hypothetical protein